MNTQTIYNYRQVNEYLITGGQPTADQLTAAAAEGFSVVINLALSDSPTALPDEAELVRSLGMTYYHIPVVWNNPQADDFATFVQVMQALPPGKTLLHCAANYRATAFYSLYAGKYLGWTAAQAEAFRATVWQVTDYPIWEKFIQEMTH